MNENFADYPNEQKSYWGCILGGCLGMFLLLVVGVGATAFFGYRFVQSQIAQYTSDAPEELPVVEYSKQEQEELHQRVDTLKEKIEAGQAAEPLVLTADDINSMIAEEEKLRGRVFVRINDGQISADLSLPLDELPGGKGRYFNGSITANVSLNNGVLVVTLDDATVNGEPVPEEILSQLRGQNLAADAYKDPKSAEILKRFESIEVRENQVILTPATDSTASSQETDAPQPGTADRSAEEPIPDDPANDTGPAETPQAEVTQPEATGTEAVE